MNDLLERVEVLEKKVKDISILFEEFKRSQGGAVEGSAKEIADAVRAYEKMKGEL